MNARASIETSFGAAAKLAGPPLDVAVSLRAVNDDARLSFNELARRVHLSAPAVAERVRRLEHRGVITGYSAHIEPGCRRIPGRGVCAIAVLTRCLPAKDDVRRRLPRDRGDPQAQRRTLFHGQDPGGVSCPPRGHHRGTRQARRDEHTHCAFDPIRRRHRPTAPAPNTTRYPVRRMEPRPPSCASITASDQPGRAVAVSAVTRESEQEHR